MLKLTKEDKNKSIQHHYQWESTDGHVALVDLVLFKNQTFKYSIGSNTYNAYSTGNWKLKDNNLTLNSDFQEGTLPIKISYRRRDTTDFTVKEIAFVRDQTGKVIYDAFVHVNNDSIRCLDGDLLCDNEYDGIDSIRVSISNKGLSSKWIPIEPHDGLIQITILTKQNLEKYLGIKNKKYILYNNKLKQIIE